MGQVLFVCVENAGRSLMAETFLKKYAPHIQVSSAGTNPACKPNPMVVQVMREVGIDIDATPKALSAGALLEYHTIVNMGCMDSDSCPALFLNDIDNWGIPDPKGKSIEDVRIIRDLIESKVRDMTRTLDQV